LQREWFQSLLEAQVIIKTWILHYNTQRPHSSLTYQTPAAFSAQHAIQPDQILIPVEHKN
jgi:putative transposase